MKDLKGKVVLITGAGSGLGRLMSFSFAREGCRLALLDIRLDLLEETKKQVLERTPSAEVETYDCDVSKREIIYQVSDQVLNRFKKVDVLVNNAGIVSGKRFLDCDDEMIQVFF
jgi:all-trans-retinol dehydrogenase (NAD+)